VAVFVLLVVRVSVAIAIVHPKPACGFDNFTNTPKVRLRQAFSLRHVVQRICDGLTFGLPCLAKPFEVPALSL
jgi:hypothetical protein